MTKRAFWDWCGNLWELNGDYMVLLWNGSCEDNDGLIDGWWREPVWIVEQMRGPLVGVA